MYELLVILYASVFEIRALITGEYTPIFRWLGNSIGAKLLVAIFSISYLAVAIYWCFNHSVWIQAAGFLLVAMSAVTALFQFQNSRLWVRLDSITSLICLSTVSFFKVKGLI